MHPNVIKIGHQTKNIYVFLRVSPVTTGEIAKDQRSHLLHTSAFI